MNASYSSLELDSISRSQCDADSEAVRGRPVRSIHSQMQDFLLDTESTYARYKPIGHSSQPTPTSTYPRRRRKWRSVASHCNACCLVAVVIVALILLPLLGTSFSYSGTEYPRFGFCEPDGTFNTGLESVSTWSPSKAFQITLAFGSMSFSTAKFIDIIWDVLVGRGLQVVLGFILYRGLTKCLARIMESSPVSFNTFESITLQGPSVWALCSLVKDYITNRGARAKLGISWMILAMAYVLIFPTLLSAMTGYSATTKAYVQTPDGSQVEWSSFGLVNYVLIDGWRVGLTGNYPVKGVRRDESSQTDPSNFVDADFCSDYGSYYEPYLSMDQEYPKKCLLTTAVSEYARKYGFHSGNHTSSTFSPDNSTIFNLTSPTLNISAFYLNPNGNLFGTPIGNYYLRSGVQEAFDNASHARFARIDQAENRTYDIPYLKANGRCQQQNTYQWGFSFLLLFITLLLSALWALGMWAMWLDAYYNSKIDAAGGRDMGSWRAVMDLAEGISSSLNSETSGGGPEAVAAVARDKLAETKNLGDREMRRRVKRASGRGWIGYMSLVVGPDMAVMTRALRLRRWLESKAWGRWLLRWRGWVIAGSTLAILLITVVFPVMTSVYR